MYTGTSRAASPELETARLRHRGLISERSAGSCADIWDAAETELQIIDERRGGVLQLGGVKQDTNIVWVAPAPSDESPGVKTLSMILREAGFDVPDHDDSASLDVDLGDFSSVCDNSHSSDF